MCPESCSTCSTCRKTQKSSQKCNMPPFAAGQDRQGPSDWRHESWLHEGYGCCGDALTCRMNISLTTENLIVLHVLFSYRCLRHSHAVLTRRIALFARSAERASFLNSLWLWRLAISPRRLGSEHVLLDLTQVHQESDQLKKWSQCVRQRPRSRKLVVFAFFAHESDNWLSWPAVWCKQRKKETAAKITCRQQHETNLYKSPYCWHFLSRAISLSGSVKEKLKCDSKISRVRCMTLHVGPGHI